ncbi:MAG: threonine aldolase [Polaromonas sp. 39-63-203]|jgi:threonine aldolase|uniref:GntG family PLP-dependent aldolase n=1 Tax=Polaromonas sp. TaxID=1869339 RepID=UPI000BC6B484|nr:GntG family PLP-dependent aldolase [Polaromonas sp.]OYY53194.1 MAG: threonine aldolase [Polaromonas sp. 35-63-240]OYZ00006.1 MAG: threonine aldolase [Polaromonas sp. 28-63-22]OYZ84529.1 MAG: threonine aldolase [Polaromonas sp. 24-62-144]OZB01025.1 MAG: threonine aldolase [Polaromonas sp. 39-63-203]HQS30506.1 GntG family PLP-dependent aldolase [Polaromonas sp.]
MTDKTVDLRSDTVTQPTGAMRAAMHAAPLGDDVFGDDPSVNALQEKIAAMLGFEAALFVPTGTQSNLCGILSHCQRGDEYIVGQQAHCYRWEGGGAAVFGSVQPQPLTHQADGSLSLDDIEAAIKPDDAHFARTRLLALENTLGGKLLPFDYVQQATRLAKDKGLMRHLDGARLFNAAVAQAQGAVRAEPVEAFPSGEQRKNISTSAVGTGFRDDVVAQARRIAGCFDSVSVCFSKGLGAPVGSALCGSKDFIDRAHRIRKMAGGGMRQGGFLAAAALHALDHHIDRLADDHALARRLAEGLAGIDGLQVEAPQTNMVFVDLTGAAKEQSAALLKHLSSHGIQATGLYRLRFVTHLDVDADGIDRAIAAIRTFFRA